MYKFFVFSFFVFSFTILNGQEISLAGRLGFNLSKMNGTNIPFKEHAKLKPGFGFGIGSLISIGNRHEVQANLFFENKGRIYEFPYRRVKSNFDFLVFSITHNYKLRKNLPLFFKLGLYSGYLIEQRSKIIEERTFVSYNTDIFKKIDFGPSVGINYRFKLWENISIGIEESFAFSLKNTYKRPKDERLYDFNTYKHYVFATNIELMIALR